MRPYALLLYYLAIRVSRAYVHIQTYKEYQKIDGNDHRPLQTNTQQSAQQIYNIAKIFEKRKLLEQLQNPSVPVHMKMRRVEDRTIRPANIFAGGLMKDFDFGEW